MRYFQDPIMVAGQHHPHHHRRRRPHHEELPRFIGPARSGHRHHLLVSFQRTFRGVWISRIQRRVHSNDPLPPTKPPPQLQLQPPRRIRTKNCRRMKKKHKHSCCCWLKTKQTHNYCSKREERFTNSRPQLYQPRASMWF